MTGSSGLIGTALVAALIARGDEVVAARRRPVDGEANAIHWDPAAGFLSPADVEGFDAVVHLAGAGVGDERWSEERKRIIYESRIDSTKLLASRLAAASAKPSVLVSASAIGFYGDRGDEILTEDSPPGPDEDFLTSVTVDWEDAASPAAEAGIRVVHPRTGIVLDTRTGALGKMLLPFKMGIGGKLGSGTQWWSWIHIEDEVRALIHLIDSDLAGSVNLTAPVPVTNAAFTKALASVLRRPAFMPVPKPALYAMLGRELAETLGYTSTKVVPSRLISGGFTFRFPELRPALEELLR